MNPAAAGALLDHFLIWYFVWLLHSMHVCGHLQLLHVTCTRLTCTRLASMQDQRPMQPGPDSAAQPPNMVS
jgi:hypothetical protein